MLTKAFVLVPQGPKQIKANKSKQKQTKAFVLVVMVVQ